jgi:hypothetical protein
VILDTDGNIFTGFNPVMWDSPEADKYKADPSRKNFLFTLKNPHNIRWPVSRRRFRKHFPDLRVAVIANTNVLKVWIAVGTIAVVS